MNLSYNTVCQCRLYRQIRRPQYTQSAIHDFRILHMSEAKEDYLDRGHGRRVLRLHGHHGRWLNRQQWYITITSGQHYSNSQKPHLIIIHLSHNSRTQVSLHPTN